VLLVYCFEFSWDRRPFVVSYMPGQSSKDFPLQEERLVFPVTRARNKAYTAPTADKIQRHFAASFANKTGTNEFC
jgi:hypothetical protein